MTVYSVSMPDPSARVTGRETYYKDFLKPVVDPRQARSGNLAVRVLASQTGGLVLGPDNDLAGEIDRCVSDANNFYQLTFDAPQSH